jgi:hypothetical protein
MPFRLFAIQRGNAPAQGWETGCFVMWNALGLVDASNKVGGKYYACDTKNHKWCSIAYMFILTGCEYLSITYIMYRVGTIHHARTFTPR